MIFIVNLPQFKVKKAAICHSFVCPIVKKGTCVQLHAGSYDVVIVSIWVIDLVIDRLTL